MSRIESDRGPGLVQGLGPDRGFEPLSRLDRKDALKGIKLSNRLDTERLALRRQAYGRVARHAPRIVEDSDRRSTRARPVLLWVWSGRVSHQNVRRSPHLRSASAAEPPSPERNPARGLQFVLCGKASRHSACPSAGHGGGEVNPGWLG